MGNSYSAQRGIWWNGTSDVSSTTIQDDMAVISNSTNNFGYRAQDHGQSRATANSLSVSGLAISGSGIISKTTDTDYFTFTTGAGTVTLHVNVAQFGPTLHAKAQLFDSSGNLIAMPSTPTTLGQTIRRRSPQELIISRSRASDGTETSANTPSAEQHRRSLPISTAHPMTM